MVMEHQLESFFKEPRTILQSMSHVGGGAFANVYDSDGIMPNTVMKSGNISREKIYDGWPLWAIFCMTKRGSRSIFPKIHALNIDLTSGYFFAVIERLKKIPVDDQMWCSGNFSDRPWRDERLLLDEEKLALDDMKRFFEGFGFNTDAIRFDGHGDNWMYRDVGGVVDQLVLTDPFVIDFEYRERASFIDLSLDLFQWGAEINHFIQLKGVHHRFSVIPSPYETFF